MTLTRRDVLRGLGGAAALRLLGCADAPLPTTSAAEAPSCDDAWRNRGIILTPPDLSWSVWPERAREAGLTTIALHSATPFEDLVPFVQSQDGGKFLDRCAALGLAVEYEVHAVQELLPRSLFATQPDLFRTDENCQRQPDGNLCVHNPRALEIAAGTALQLCRTLRSTTDRYFLWPADQEGPWCQCACCAPLAASDQALTLENYLVGALRSEFPQATLAHLAYTLTLDAPTSVRPAPGVFLEFCPFYRRYDIPFDTPSDPTQAMHLAALDANLAVFGQDGAQALEFWMDASRISGWQLPPKQLKWNQSIFESDVATYHARGVHHVTSFGVFLNAQYVSLYGEPPVGEYGIGLARNGRAPSCARAWSG